ncbi:MAG: DUF1330 domain-containing protein [Pseudomonadota bacterium]
MKVVNEVTPSDPNQLLEMTKPGPDGPVFMVNLLKFKDKAEYADGRATDLSGREAYQIYGTGVTALLPQFGGQIFFMAEVTWLQLGQVEDLWDEVAIAVYPNREALLKMSSSQEWRDIAVHREAGLAGQLNIESVMPEPLKALPWIDLLLKDIKA